MSTVFKYCLFQQITLNCLYFIIQGFDNPDRIYTNNSTLSNGNQSYSNENTSKVTTNILETHKTNGQMVSIQRRRESQSPPRCGVMWFVKKSYRYRYRRIASMNINFISSGPGWHPKFSGRDVFIFNKIVGTLRVLVNL